MSNVKKSLTRKIGPLPVWAWALVVFGGVWYYRNKLSAASQTESGTGTGSVGPAAPPDLGPPIDVPPGDSIYDPNNPGVLVTAPGGDGSGGNGGGSGGGSTTGPSNGGGGGSSTPPPKRTSPRRHPHHRDKYGNIYTGGYSRRPPRKKGYTLRGIGGGWWEYVKDKRTPKGKNQHGKPKDTTKHNKPGDKKRHRSGATIRNQVGGRITVPIYSHPGNTRRIRGGVKPHASLARTSSNARLTHNIVSKPTVRTRPVATASPHTPVRHSAQPSVHRAPQTRSVRTPSTHRSRRKR